MFIPFIIIIPGMLAAVLVSPLADMKSKGAATGSGGITYNDSLLLLMKQLLPNGLLGVAIAGLLAAFMAGMAANVSSFNTVFTYDIWQTYIKKNFPDHYYLNVGRLVTVAGILIGIGTAFIASQFSNIMNYIQTLFSFFNAPLFIVFIVGLVWKRTSPWGGFYGQLAGIVSAVVFQYLIGPNWAYMHAGQVISGEPNAQMINFYGAFAAIVVGAVVTVAVSLVTKPKPLSELVGLVYGNPDPEAGDPHEGYVRKWYESPKVLGYTALGIVVVLSIIFI